MKNIFNKLLLGYSVIVLMCTSNHAFSETTMKSNASQATSSWQQFEFENDGERAVLGFK